MKELLSAGVLLEGSDNLTLTPPPLRDKRKYDRASKNAGRYKKFIQPENCPENCQLDNNLRLVTRRHSQSYRTLSCALASCGKPVPHLKIPSKVRGRRRFCCREHYWQFLRERGGGYRPWRQGQRSARKAVSQHFNLAPRNVVHHKDGNNRNNSLSNLAVFSSQSDHLSFHRGGPVQPIWDGGNADTAPVQSQEGLCTT